jgi:hypothetical protein
MALNCPNCGEAITGGKLWNGTAICDDCHHLLTQMAGIRGQSPQSIEPESRQKSPVNEPPGLTPAVPLMSRLKGFFRK